MLSYLSQHPDDGISDAAEMQMLVDLEDIEGENGEIGLKLEQLMQKDLPGRAFFHHVFHHSSSLLMEFQRFSALYHTGL